MRKIILLVLLVGFTQSVNAWGFKSKTSQPATASSAKEKAEEQAAEAKRSAEMAIEHAETAGANLQSVIAELEIKRAKADTANAQKAAKEASINAAWAAFKSALSGSEEAKLAKQQAENAALEAKEAARLAQAATDEVEAALRRLQQSQEDYNQALAYMDEQQYLSYLAELLLKSAEEADESYTKAWNEYKKSKTELDTILKELEKDRDLKSEEDYMSLKQEYEEKEKKSKEAFETAAFVGDAAVKAYEKLGTYYKEIGYSGDPVSVGTGDYICEYEDYRAQDYLDVFTVDRKYRISDYKESFGKNWICSLDSRIIRCNFEDLSYKKTMIQNGIDYCNQMINCFSEYKENYPDFPRDETEDYIKEAESFKRTLNNELSELEELIEIRNKIQEKNKYSTYGQYSNPHSYYGFSNQLIFVDEEGQSSYFINDGNGLWISAGKISQNQMKIYSTETGKGYEVVYSDGRKAVYDDYGILQLKIDSNGNETKYENTAGYITKVILKTGEILEIVRDSENCILEINGPVSGSSRYFYSNSLLNKAVDNLGVKVEYDYSPDYMTGIYRADGSFIQLEYEFNGTKQKNVCTKLRNEKGEEERFQYDYSNNTVFHYLPEDKVEYYRINEAGNPVYIKDQYGNVTILENDENYMIKSISRNGVKRQFVYDSNFNPQRILLDNGGVIYLSYNEDNNLNLLTGITDADGFQKQYFYDNKGNMIEERYCGNLIGVYEYYPNGLLKSKGSNNKTELFEYNSFGSIVRRTILKPKGQDDVYDYIYDEKNSLQQIKRNGTITETYVYSPGTRKEKTGFVENEIIFDGRNRTEKFISKDLITDRVVEKKYKYDGNGNVLKLYINNNLCEENEYNYDSSKKSEILWSLSSENQKNNIQLQGVKKEYFYNDKGLLTEIKTSAVEDDSDKVGLRLLDDSVYSVTMNYVTSGNLTEVTFTNESGIVSKSIYDKFENLVSEEFGNGYIRKTTYSKAGRIICITDSDYYKWEYIYKNDGSYIVNVSYKGRQVENYIYDSKDNLISCQNELFGKKKFSYEEDNLIEENAPDGIFRWDYQNSRITRAYKINNSGRIIEDIRILYLDNENKIQLFADREDAYFAEYSFNGYGNPIQIINNRGITKYKYDDFDRVNKIIDGKLNETDYIYDANSCVCCIQYPDNQKRFLYHNVNGDVTKVVDNNRVLQSYTYNSQNKSMGYTDCFGTSYDFMYDSNGTLISEDISKSGKLLFDFKETNNKFSAGGNNNSLSKNKNRYEYNSLGKLLSIEDDYTNSSIFYEYDQYGRCIEKNINGQRFQYEYDTCGLVSDIYDKPDNRKLVHIEYDVYYRPETRTYLDGTEERFVYNTYGLLDGRVIKDSIGQIVSAECFQYDEKGRLTYSFNKAGNFTHYCYNPKGQLESVEYPYTEKLAAYRLSEAADCGYPLGYEYKPAVSYITSAIKEDAAKVLRKLQIESAVSIPNYQESWKEEYTYTSTGSISTEKNPITTFVYQYDSDNRLQEKYSQDFPDNRLKLQWNESGCLTKINGVNSRIEAEYNQMNKIALLNYSNLWNSENLQIQYFYDETGRRSMESYNGEAYVVTIYDGLSNIVLQKTPVYKNGILEDNSVFSTVNGVYRYAESESYTPYGSAKALTDNTNNSVLQQENVLFINHNNSILMEYKNLEYCVSERDYSNRESGIFSVYGEPFDVEYDLLNCFKSIGNRDYISGLKTFMSEDSKKDGINWYAYCSGDPVNYIDVDGYEIIPVPQRYLMTDLEFLDIKVGNSKQSDDTITKVGCYLASYANIASVLYSKGVLDKENVIYTSVLGINMDKVLFSTENNSRADLKRNDSMNKIFNNENEKAKVTWDYFTKDVSGEMRLKIELAKANALQEDNMVMGVFDLSEKYEKVPNHMVVINEIYNENGVFDNITYSSKNDGVRQKENPNVYCVDNLKEIRIVKIENKKCGK